jgi:tRNA modification GTPase
MISSQAIPQYRTRLQCNKCEGGFQQKDKIASRHLVNFASLIELELDFSEEDVEFADRRDLKKLH